MKTLGDPINEVRLFAAKAIGNISKALGSENANKEFSFLYTILEDNNSTSIERSGAASAVSEVVCGMGIQYVK